MINPPTSFVSELCVELFTALDGKDYARGKRISTKAKRLLNFKAEHV
jgi:hypothetical protein